MKMQFKVENPETIELSMTMNLAQWVKLSEQINAAHWQACDLSAKIVDMIVMAKKWMGRFGAIGGAE